MKKFGYTLLILFVLACVCVVTCPDKKAHSDALKELLNTVLTEELSGDSEEDGLTIVASMIGTGIGGALIDNLLKVDNYFVCSIGKVTYKGETNIVTFGIMNHVFTIDREDALRKAEGIYY